MTDGMKSSPGNCCCGNPTSSMTDNPAEPHDAQRGGTSGGNQQHGATESTTGAATTTSTTAQNGTPSRLSLSERRRQDPTSAALVDRMTAHVHELRDASDPHRAVAHTAWRIARLRQRMRPMMPRVRAMLRSMHLDVAGPRAMPPSALEWAFELLRAADAVSEAAARANRLAASVEQAVGESLDRLRESRDRRRAWARRSSPAAMLPYASSSSSWSSSSGPRLRLSDATTGMMEDLMRHEVLLIGVWHRYATVEASYLDWQGSITDIEGEEGEEEDGEEDDDDEEDSEAGSDAL